MPAAKFHKVSALLADGKSTAECAYILGCKEKTLRQWCRDNGVAIKRVTPVGWWDDDKIESAKALYADGRSANEIGKRLGCSRNAVIGKLSRLGLMGSGTRGAGGESLRASRMATANRKRRAAGKKAAKFRLAKLKRVAVSEIVALPPPLPPPETPPPNATSLLDLTDGQCRYPYGDKEIVFCPEMAKTGSSYCAGHHALCWNPVPPRRAVQEKREMVLQ